MILWVIVVGGGVEIICFYFVKEVEVGRNVLFLFVFFLKVFVMVFFNVIFFFGWEGKFLVGGDFVRGVYFFGESIVEFFVSVFSNVLVGWYFIEVGVGDVWIILLVYVLKSYVGENGIVIVKVFDFELGNYILGVFV